MLDDQKRYNRVRTAIKEKDSIVKSNIKNNNIKLNELNILIIAYKEEGILDIYMQKTNQMKHIKKSIHIQ